MFKRLLKKIYFSSLGKLLSQIINPLWRYLNAPKMLWGYRDISGEWRIRTRISDSVFFNHPEKIRIADEVFIWHYTILDGTGGLEIGRGTHIRAWVGIFTHSAHQAIRLYGGHYHEVSEDEKVAFDIFPVKIGNYTFVGAGAKILPNVTIGHGAIISAGSIVSKNVADFQIVAGSPAQVVGDTRKLDALYLRRNPQLQTWYKEWTAACLQQAE